MSKTFQRIWFGLLICHALAVGLGWMVEWTQPLLLFFGGGGLAMSVALSLVDKGAVPSKVKDVDLLFPVGSYILTILPVAVYHLHDVFLAALLTGESWLILLALICKYITDRDVSKYTVRIVSPMAAVFVLNELFRLIPVLHEWEMAFRALIVLLSATTLFNSANAVFFHPESRFINTVHFIGPLMYFSYLAWFWPYSWAPMLWIELVLFLWVCARIYASRLLKRTITPK